MRYNLINVWNRYDNIYKTAWRSKLNRTHRYNIIDIDWVDTGLEIESYYLQIQKLIEIIKGLTATNGIKGIIFFHDIIFPSIELISYLDKREFIFIGWCNENLGYIDKSYISKSNVSIFKSLKWKYHIESAMLRFYDMIFCESDTIRKILLKNYKFLAQHRKVQVIGLPHLKPDKDREIPVKENIIVFPYFDDIKDGYELFNLAQKMVNPQLKEEYTWIRIPPAHPEYTDTLKKAKFGLSFNRRFGNDYGIRDCIFYGVIAFCPKKKYRKKSSYNNLLSNIQYKDFNDCINKLQNAINNPISQRAYKGIINRLNKKLIIEENWTFKKMVKIITKLIQSRITL